MTKTAMYPILLAIILAFTSCSSLEKDAKELAELNCKLLNGKEEDLTLNETMKVAKLTKRLEGKYDKGAAKAKFEKAYFKFFSECK